MHSHSATTNIKSVAEKLWDCTIKVALVGAPNVGKSVLFNTLTGQQSMVANWPGVTVDIQIGKINVRGEKACIIDLPGAYGLVPTSPEEEVTLEALLTLKPDKIVALLDSTNPEGSLNLVLQLIEAAPERVVVAVTKYAISHAMGVHIDVEKLSRVLGVPVVPVSALEGQGLDQLLAHIASRETFNTHKLWIDYGLLKEDLEELANNSMVIEAAEHFRVTPEWLAIQLLGNNESLLSILEEHGYHDLVSLAMKAYESAMKKTGLRPELYIAERRLAFIEHLASEVVVRRKPAGSYWQKIADVLIHPVIGPIGSLVGLLLTFAAVFSVNTGFPLNIIFRALGYEGVASLLDEYNLASLLDLAFTYLSNIVKDVIPGPAGGLIGDGIIGGVGFVLSFLPLVMLVYLFLGLLEDSGLATRMAISFHPLFYRFGLSGRSVFPLLLGMGCNVPAEYATKSLPEEERLRAVFAVPFIPCQARLAVIIAITSVMVTSILEQSIAITIIYTEAIIAALLTSLIVSRVVQPRLMSEKARLLYQPKPELIMELPPVHKPHWRVVWWYVRDNTMHFIRKAGTVIFLLAVITWGLLSYGPNGYTANPDYSYGAILGDYVGKVTRLIGVGPGKDRILGLALLDGLIAKEGVLTAIAISLGFQEESVHEAIGSLGLTFPQALGFLVMITLYFPCIATLAAMRSITRSWKLVLAYAAYSILLAITFATITYHVVVLVD